MVLKLKPDQERVRVLLKDTISLLCRNGLEFNGKFEMEALIGITLDDEKVFMMSFNELVKSNNYVSPPNSDHEEKNVDKHGQRKRRKRKRPSGTVKTEIMSGESGADDVDALSEGSSCDNSSHEDATSMSQRQDDTNASNLATETGDVEQYDEGDIVIIKEEKADFWQSEPSCSQTNPEDSFTSDYNNYNMDTSQLSQPDQNFSLSESTLVPIGNQEGNQFWSPSSSSMQYRPHIRQQHRNTQHSGSEQPNSQVFGQPNTGSDDSLTCHICSKVFTQKINLRAHLNWHNGKYLMYCEICKKGFMSQTTLRGHMARHTGIKEFRCDMCGLEYTQKYALKRHMNSRHKHKDDSAGTSRLVRHMEEEVKKNRPISD